MAGTEAKQATKKYVFNPTEKAAVNQRVRDKAQAAGEQAYDAAIAAGKDEKKAKNDANKAARQTAQAEAKVEAERAAHVAAQQAIANGTAFNTSKLDALAQAQLTNYPASAVEAKRLGPELQGKSEGDFLAFMSQEVSNGSVPSPTIVNIPAPAPHTGTQPMQMWEYPDGTVVRYKPLGDTKRPNATYSIEVKKNPALPDTGPDDAAFKVDKASAAVPKNPEEAVNPYPKGSEQYKAFEKALMDAGHRSLTP